MKLVRKMIPILLVIAMAATMTFVGVMPASGQLADAPWPMFRHDSRHTGRSPYTGTEVAGQKWRFTPGCAITASPAVGSDHTIYFGTGVARNDLYAVNPDGTEKWSFTTGYSVSSCPAIGADGTIYVGSADSKLYAINPDGSLKWSFTTGGGVRSSPAIGADGTIYVGSWDNDLYAINPDGTPKWSFTTGDMVSSSPAIGADGTIYVGSFDNNLYAINPDGSPKWSFTTGYSVSSCPAIGADGTIYVGCQHADFGFYAIGEAPHGVYLMPSSQVGCDLPGGTVSYTFEVTNRMGSDDSFDLLVSGNTWPTNLSIDSTGTIADGESVNFTAEVEIPALASLGDTDTANITATSVSAPNITDTATVITTPLSPSEVWVDDDWAGLSPGDPADGHTFGYDAFAKIQDGIDAVGGSIVHVAAGTYYENITLKDGVQVLGAGAYVTTIDGSTARGGLPAYHVVVGANNATLDGFTVTGGNANGVGNDGYGGGMYNSYSSPIVTNCSFYNNLANWAGGGMRNLYSSLTVTNCRFSSNSATWGGGMLNAGSSPTVTNCIFSGNSATWGGGMYNRFNSSPPVNSCTFSSNWATYGGGMYNEGSSPTVTNCILWDTGEEIANDVSSTPLVTYCDVQGGYSGVGNIDADPVFADPAGGNYHLQAGSPCIDAGTNVGAPTEDIEGNPRPIDGDGDGTATTDMGAYEYVPPPKISSSPSNLTFVTWCGEDPDPETLDIWNSGGGTLNWTVSDDAPWLTESPAGGSLGAGEHDYVTVSVNTSGMNIGLYSANITITGSANVTVPVTLEIKAAIDVVRNLPDVTYPGDTFDVFVSFTAPTDEFNAIGLTDLAPDGWEVAVDEAWCTPNADQVKATGNKTEILWYGPYGNGTNFTAKYKVTVPETAELGISEFPLDDCSKGWVEYYFGELGPYTSCVIGEDEMTVTVTIDVMRNLPDVALMPNETYPGDTFDIFVNFTAPVDYFNAIGLTDYAPAGWEVETNVTWCTPIASWTMSPYNKAEYAWAGPNTSGTNFSAMYKVTIPATANPGINEWPNCTPIPCPPCEGSPINSYAVWVEYWFGADGPYESCITGDYQKIVTVPDCVVGETRDVNGDLLDTVLVSLYEDPADWEDTDSSSIVGTSPSMRIARMTQDTTGSWLKNIATTH